MDTAKQPKDLTGALRQAKWREQQKQKAGRTNRTFNVTDDEAFYLQRVLEQMRREGSVPAQMRLKNGRMSTLDA